MRAFRILLIVAVVLGGLFVIADRVAVGFAEDEVADRLKVSEGLATTPDVSIKGFPFLTQVAGGELDDVEVGIKDYEAATGVSGQNIRIDDLTAQMRGVEFTGDYSSATAATATGSATISYDQLLKAANAQETQLPLGITAKVVGLSDGGNGKIKVAVEVSTLKQPVYLLSSVTVVDGNTVRVRADSIPSLDADVQLADAEVQSIADFEQKIEGLPGGIELDSVEAGKTGVDISVKGSNVSLAG
ncbi:LmeA family phospholipid-binding protein [Streptomyces sp. NPDC002156]